MAVAAALITVVGLRKPRAGGCAGREGPACHPLLAVDAQVALNLKRVAGLATHSCETASDDGFPVRLHRNGIYSPDHERIVGGIKFTNWAGYIHHPSRSRLVSGRVRCGINHGVSPAGRRVYSARTAYRY